MSWWEAAAAVLEGLASQSESNESKKKSRRDRQHDIRSSDYNLRLANFFGESSRAEDQRLKREGWNNWFTGDKPERRVPDEPSLEEYLRNTK